MSFMANSSLSLVMCVWSSVEEEAVKTMSSTYSRRYAASEPEASEREAVKPMVTA
jgi:hypothetical protein